MQKDKVIFTGGHGGTTALATAISARSLKKNWEIHWIGAKKAVEGKRALTLEFKALPKYEVRCHSLFSARLQKRFTRHTIISLAKLPLSFLQSFVLLIKIRPQIVVSFGGFAAFPVVFWSHFLKIPVIIHEQTMAIGLANKLSIPFAKVVAISRKESSKYFPNNKTILTGNPVSPQIALINPKKEIGKPPTIFVIGGSRGSQIINNVIYKSAKQILINFKLIHITGEFDYKKFTALKENLPSNLTQNYKVYKFVKYQKMPNLFEKADIIISRGGANTVSEIITSTRPAIIIPIPWTRFNEQTKNAKLVQSIGLGILLSQDKLTPKSLLDAINEVYKNWSKMIKSTPQELISLDENAAQKLVNLISTNLK